MKRSSEANDNRERHAQVDFARFEVEFVDEPGVNGEYGRPVRIVAFNTAEGWSRDVTTDIADELRRRYVEFGEVPDSVLEFIESNRR